MESIREWGYNSSFVTAGGTPMTRIGPKNVDIFTSSDGVTFTFAESLVFAEAPGNAGCTGHLIPADYHGIRYIRLFIRTNHDGAVFDGSGSQPCGDGRSLTGLSEIGFGIAAPPAPPEVISSGFNGTAFRVTAGGFDLAHSYSMTRSSDLRDGFPTAVDGMHPPAAAADDFVDPAPPPGRAFYRIEESS